MINDKICFVISPIGKEGSDIRKRSDLTFDYITWISAHLVTMDRNCPPENRILPDDHYRFYRPKYLNNYSY